MKAIGEQFRLRAPLVGHGYPEAEAGTIRPNEKGIFTLAFIERGPAKHRHNNGSPLSSALFRLEKTEDTFRRCPQNALIGCHQ